MSYPSFIFTLAAAASLAFAQPPSGGWRRAGDPPPAPAEASRPPVPAAQDPAEPVDRSDQFGQTAAPQAPAPDRPAYGLPPTVTIKPGTFITVRMNDELSSDHNQAGDPFSATLVEPVVVDGIVAAYRGQTVYGRVVEVEKQRTGQPSRLGIEMTGLTLADGSQVPLRSQLVTRQGSTTPGSVQAGTVASTTAVGAVIGAAADWGTGAAVGAGVGAAAGIVGVLLTRNHATVLYPETSLVFRIEAPVTVATGRAPQAFRYVGPEDYERAPERPALQRRPGPPAYPYGYYSPYYGPYYGFGYGYGYPYWGTGIGFAWGPRFYGGRGYYRRR
jgi:hypothetical protein